MRFRRLAVTEASCVHSPGGVIILAIAVFVVSLVNAGCEPMVDCVITVFVIDAGTEAPLDSVQVFVTYFDPAPPGHLGKRYFVGTTDVNGRWGSFTGCDGIKIIEVEKDGYQTAKQTTVHGGSVLYFALHPIASNQVGSVPARSRQLRAARKMVVSR